MSHGLPIPNGVSPDPPLDGRIPRNSDPAALERTREQIATLKAGTFTSWARDRTFEAGQAFYPAKDGTWQDLSEAGKLAVLDFWVSWDGVSLRDRREEVLRHIDVTKLPTEFARQLLGPEPQAAAKPRAKDRDIEPER